MAGAVSVSTLRGNKMKVGDLVRHILGSSHIHALVLRAPPGDPCIFVKVLKTGKAAWLNKAAFEVISESR